MEGDAPQTLYFLDLLQILVKTDIFFHSHLIQ